MGAGDGDRAAVNPGVKPGKGRGKKAVLEGSFEIQTGQGHHFTDKEGSGDGGGSF